MFRDYPYRLLKIIATFVPDKENLVWHSSIRGSWLPFRDINEFAISSIKTITSTT